MPFVFFYLVLIALLAYRSHRQHKRATETARRVRDGNAVWLADWLAEKKVDYFHNEGGMETSFFFDYDLRSCRAYFKAFMNYKTGDFLVDIRLPVRLDRSRHREINDLLQSFEGRMEKMELRLDGSKGTLHLRMERYDEGFLQRSIPYQLEQFLLLLHLADELFPACMTVLYGNRLPDVEMSKLFGLRGYELN